MRAGYFRVFTVLVAMMAAAVVAMLVAYGSASAEEGACLNDSNQECRSFEPTPPPPDPLTVVSTFPKDGATNVDPDTNIKAKFSEQMMKSSINRTTFRLYKGDLTDADLNPECYVDEYFGDITCSVLTPPPTRLRREVSYNAKKNLAILNPVPGLRANTTYTAVVEGAGDIDGRAVKDKAGNEMATDYIWHFTTGSR